MPLAGARQAAPAGRRHGRKATPYELFLDEHNLAEKKPRDPVVIDVSGRPSDALTGKLRLDLIDELVGVNALLNGAALAFGPFLTVIYGRNGAGKSGFARVFANACFSPHSPKLFSNIYEETAQPEPAARFSFSLNDH